MVPVFTANRSISLAPSFAPAASPRLRRSPSSWPSCRHAKPATKSATHTGWSCTASRPISTRFEPAPRLRSFNTGSSRIPSDLARRTRPVWQYQTVPALSALLPTLPGVSRIRLRSAPARLLRQPGEEVSHLLRFPAPHGAPAPRGAPRSRYQSALLRASREDSSDSTIPALPSPTSATRSEKPLRPWAEAPERPRSSSTTTIWCSAQPSSPGTPGQVVLPEQALGVADRLDQRRLADIDIGVALQVGSGRLSHRPAPPRRPGIRRHRSARGGDHGREQAQHPGPGRVGHLVPYPLAVAARVLARGYPASAGGQALLSWRARRFPLSGS